MNYIGMVVDYGIIGLLITMSIVACAIVIERLLVFRNLRIEDFGERKTLEIELARKIHPLATVGSNAPYIGLLGTVFGIVVTFYTIGTDGLMDTGKIMIGLALALKATAVGLLVVIPSMVFYNLPLRRVKAIIAKWEASGGRKRV